MADEKVDIVLKVKVHDRQLKELMAKIKAVEQMEKRLSSGSRMQNYANRMSSANARWKKSFDMVDTAVKMTGKALTKVLGFAIKGVLIEMALLSVALVGIHALFVAGRGLMKAYSAGMSLLAGGAAIAGAALATVAAAIREQQAAMYAYRGKGAPQFGSAMNQTRMAMRNLQADASLASLGIENLNKAYGVMSKTMNVNQINASGKAIKALMDFGSAGQDPAQSMEAVATVVAALSDQKKGVNDVLAAAQKLGPEMQKALKDAKVKTKDQFRELLFSGKLAELGGVAGQFDAVNNTLIGVAKGFFNRLRTSFADFGDIFLEPLKVAFEDIFYTIKDGLAKMSVTIQQVLGVRGITSGLTTMVQRVTDFMVRMMREYLPGVVGMFRKIGDWWYRFTRGWNEFFDKLRPFQDGARSLYKALEPIWEAIKRGAQNLTLFNQLLQDNEGTAVETGQRIADLIDSISQLFFNMKKIFFEIAPFLNDVLAGLNQIIKAITSIMTMGAGKGFGMALAPLLAMGIIGRKMGATQGGLLPNFRQTSFASMSVSATNVNINTQPMIGRQGAYGPGSATGFSSGSTAGGGALASGSGGGAAGMAPGVYSYQRGSSVIGFSQMRQLLNINRRDAIRQGSQILTRGMNYQGNVTARAADVARAQADLAAQQRRIANMQQQMAVNQTPGFMSPGLRAQVNQQTASDIRRTRFNAYKNYALTRTQIGLKGALDTATYGVRSFAGGVHGYMSRLGGAGYDPVTGQITNPEASRAAVRQQFAGAKYAADGTYQSGDPRNALTRKIAERRALMRIARTETRFGLAQQRFGQSATGRMGTSMGLALASQYAPEEMRGAMALGGMASMVDPRLGIAVAGVGGALTAKSGTMGAVAGIAGGAQIGATIGGPYGALVGGVIGGIVGGISGAMRSNAEKLKKIREMAQKSLNDFYDGIAKANAEQLDMNVRRFERGEAISSAGVAGGTAGRAAGRRLGEARGMMAAMRGRTNLAGILNAYDNGQLGDMSKRDFQSTFGYDPDTLRQLLQDPNFQIANRQASSAVQAYIGKKGVTYNPVGGTPGSPGSYSLNRDLELELAGFARIQKQEGTRLAELTRITGKSTGELEVLARQLDVDLYNPMLDFNDLIQQLGLTVKKTSAEMKDAIADSMIAASAIFRTERESVEAVFALDQLSEGLAAQLGSGNLTDFETDAAVKQYFEEYSALAMTAAGGDPMKALLATRFSFESGKEGGVYAPGGVFAGQYEAINPVYQRYMSAAMKGVGDTYAGQIQADLLASGQTADFGQLSRAIANMTPQQMQDMMRRMELGGGSLTAKYTAGAGVDRYEQQGISGILKELGIDVALRTSPEQALNDVASQVEELSLATKQLDASSRGLQTAVNAMLRMQGLPEIPLPQDTSTPRGDTTSSRLSQTMSKHASFDSMVSGNRLVTSSYRDFNLGSINSDHVTGRAYDLTGQNLGQYAKLVHDNGGFAEFHGTMANRHLHVVPGIGDTAMPAMPMMTTNSSGGGGGVSNIYNIEINGTNQSPEQIANMVVAKIDQRERSYSERI